MTSFKNLSIKSKLTWVSMLTSCVALLIACTAFVTYELFRSRQAMVLELSTLADVIGKSSALSLKFDMPIGSENMFSSLGANKQIVAACLYKVDGKIWAKFPKDRLDASFPARVTEDSHRFENKSLFLFHPVVDPDNSPLGTVFIQARLDQMYNLLWEYVGIGLGVLLAAAVVAFGISSRLQQMISRPILQLSQTARIVSEKRDYSVRASQQTHDEIGTLIDSFNEMLAQIQKRDTELQQARDSANRANHAKSN